MSNASEEIEREREGEREDALFSRLVVSTSSTNECHHFRQRQQPSSSIKYMAKAQADERIERELFEHQQILTSNGRQLENSIRLE